MKHLTIAVLLIVLAITAIVAFSKTKKETIASASSPVEFQAEKPPKFFYNGGEYIFVPIPEATVTFKNPVRIREIDYPWVLVERITVPLQPQCTEPCVWVNMNQITVVKVHR